MWPQWLINWLTAMCKWLFRGDLPDDPYPRPMVPEPRQETRPEPEVRELTFEEKVDALVAKGFDYQSSSETLQLFNHDEIQAAVRLGEQRARDSEGRKWQSKLRALEKESVTEKENAREASKHHRHEICRLRQELERKERTIMELEPLKIRLERKEDKLRFKKNELREKDVELNHLHAVVDQLKEAEDWANTTQQVNSKLQESVQRLTEEEHSLMEQSREERAHFQQQCQFYNHQLQQVNGELGKVTAEMTRQTRRAQDAENRCQTLMLQLDAETRAHQIAASNLRMKETTLMNLKEKDAANQETIRCLQDNVEQHQRTIDENNAEIQELSTTNETQKLRIDDLEEEKGALIQQKDALAADLEEKRVENENNQQNIHELQYAKEDLIEKLHQKCEESTQLTEAVAELNELVNRLREQVNLHSLKETISSEILNTLKEGKSLTIELKNILESQTGDSRE